MSLCAMWLVDGMLQSKNCWTFSVTVLWWAYCCKGLGKKTTQLMEKVLSRHPCLHHYIPCEDVRKLEREWRRWWEGLHSRCGWWGGRNWVKSCQSECLGPGVLHVMSSWSELDLFKYIMSIYYIHILYAFIVLIILLDIVQIFLFLMSFGFTLTFDFEWPYKYYYIYNVFII